MATTKANVIYKLYNGTDWDIYYFKTTAGSVIESTTKKFLTPEMTINSKVLFNGAITLTADDISATSTKKYLTSSSTINGQSLFDGPVNLRANNINVSTSFATSHPEYNGNIEAVFESFITEHTAIQNSLSTINGKLFDKANIVTAIDDSITTENGKVPSMKAVVDYVVQTVNPAMEFKGVWSTTTALPSGAKKGDNYKLGVAIGSSTHKGDLLIAVKDNPSTAISTIDDGTNWSIIHGEADTNTSDTWRAIKVNGTNKLLGTISTGALNFKDGNNTNVSFDTGDSSIQINVDLSDYVTNSTFTSNNTTLNNLISQNTTSINNLSQDIDTLSSDLASLESQAATVFVQSASPSSAKKNDIWIDISGATTVSA